MTQTSSIHIDSCRSDGRCPECGADPVPAYAKQPMACGCFSSGAHCWETACAARHLNALVTEALTEINRLRHWREDESASFGMSREVCAALREERDAALRDVEMWKAKAIRVSGEADALERERDEAQAKLVEEREAMASISGELVQAQVKVAKERDEARAEVKTLRLLVESQTEQISHSAMDLYAAVQAEVKAEQRAERAEALLLAREKHNGQ